MEDLEIDDWPDELDPWVDQCKFAPDPSCGKADPPPSLSSAVQPELDESGCANGGADARASPPRMMNSMDGPELYD